MSNCWGRFFHVFMGKESYFFSNIVASALKSCIISILSILYINIFFLNFFFCSKYAQYSQSIVSCCTEDTSLRDFYIMTLTTGNWNFSQAETATRGSTHQTLQKALPIKPDWKLAPIQPTAWLDNEVGTFWYINFSS